MTTALGVVLFLLLAVAAAAATLRLGFARRIRALERAAIAPDLRPVRGLPDALAPLAELTDEPLPEEAVAIRLHQTGEMRLSEDKPWQPFTAEQVISLTKPAFAWAARIRVAPGLSVVVLDAFDGTDGHLEARLAGILPVARADGTGVAEAEAQRYLAELAWAPGALARNGHIDWRATPSGVTAATLAGRHIAKVELRLTGDGLIDAAGSPARRRGTGPDAPAEPWGGVFDDWGEIGGLVMPARAEVFWDPPGARFAYFRGRVTRAVPLDAAGRPIGT